MKKDLPANIVYWYNTFCPYPRDSTLFKESSKKLETYTGRLELKEEFDAYQKKTNPLLNFWIYL